jgi:hypothetical protein
VPTAACGLGAARYAVARRAFFLGRLFGPGVSPSFIGTNRVKVGCAARSRLGMVGGLTMPECRFYNLERDGQAVIARIDLKLDDDATQLLTRNN